MKSLAAMHLRHLGLGQVLVWPQHARGRRTASSRRRGRASPCCRAARTSTATAVGRRGRVADLTGGPCPGCRWRRPWPRRCSAGTRRALRSPSSSFFFAFFFVFFAFFVFEVLRLRWLPLRLRIRRSAARPGGGRAGAPAAGTVSACADLARPRIGDQRQGGEEGAPPGEPGRGGFVAVARWWPACVACSLDRAGAANAFSAASQSSSTPSSSQQPLLHRQAAAVAAEGAAAAQDAVAGDDERDRVGAAGGAGGADRALVAGAGRHLRVAAGLRRRGCGRSPAAPAAEVLAQLPVERQVEVGQLALEVEVELAPGLVELRRAPRGRAGRPASASSTSSSSASWLGRPTRTRPLRRASPAAAGRRASRRSCRRRRAGPPRRRARRGGSAMPSCQLLSQSFQSLVQAAARGLRRAAERGGDLGVGEVAGVAQGHRRPLLRRQRPDRVPDAVARAAGPRPRPRPPRRPAPAGGRGRGGGRSPCGGRS